MISPEALSAYAADPEASLARVRGLWAPPPSLTVSQFADREIIVTSGPLAGTKWRTDFAPYQRGILDAFHEAGVETVVVQGSSQWGKTACAVNLAAYHMAHDPCPILVVEPTVDPMARDFSKNRLQPIIEASPALRERVSKRRERDSGNTMLSKNFRGGSIAVGGANSAASLAARAVRLLILDEIDRYPRELPGEGNTIDLARKRTSSYRHRRRILMISSPTLKDGPIDHWFHQGDQRRYYVPCPHCGHMHVIAWANVRWEQRDPATAHLVCPSCAGVINNDERLAMLDGGEWRPEVPDRPDRTIVSFHLWEGYSPLSSLREIVTAFLRAREAQKGGDTSGMHTWQNTCLAEPIEHDQGQGADPHILLLRRETYGPGIDAPVGVAALTMGVDVQDDRLEYLVVGWGVGEESWLVDRGTIPGDTARPEPWAGLLELLAVEYRHGHGGLIRVQATCIDSAGHRTAEVYAFAHQHGVRRVFATIGRDGEKTIVSSPAPKRWGRDIRQVPLYTIGVDTAKTLLTDRLKLTEKGPGYVHIPHADWADEELALQLTSERLVTRMVNYRPVQVWIKIRPRNEALDCAILAQAALRLLNPRLEQWARQLDPMAPPPAPEPPAPRPSGDPWLRPGRRPGWSGSDWLTRRR